MHRKTPLRKLIEESIDELQEKMQANMIWGCGSFDRWELDQDQGILTFSNHDGYTATAAAQIIGTLNPVDSTWLWAWANESIAPSLSDHADAVRAFGEEHSHGKLTLPSFLASEDDAWEMAAIAVKINEAQGAYRASIGTIFTFVSFRDVAFSDK